MLPPEIATIRTRLLQIVPNDPDAISGLADRLQKLAKYDPELTRGCEFSKALQMRRLVILPLKGWKDTDARTALMAMNAIGRLQVAPGLAAALELACYGIERQDLPEAVHHLEQMRGRLANLDDKPAQPVSEASLAPEPNSKPAAYARKAKTKRSEVKPGQPLASLTTLDEAELDEQTKAELEALEAEVKKLKK